jgi:hypothetical protein
MEGDDIRIVPADQDTIYVPEYDPDVVYDVPSGYSGPYVTFGPGFPVGAWLGYECDWDSYAIWTAPWHPGWAYHLHGAPGAGVRQWRPDPGRVRPVVRNFYQPGAVSPRPRPMAGARPAPSRSAPAPRAAAPAPSSRPDYRGWSGAEETRPAMTSRPAPMGRPATAAPSNSAFGGYNRGTETRSFSERGQASRQAPVRSAPRAEPARAAAPARGGDQGRR